VPVGQHANQQRERVAQAAMAGNRATLAVYAGTAMHDPGLGQRPTGITTPALVLWGDSDLAVDGRLPEPMELAAYYAISEALANTASTPTPPRSTSKSPPTPGCCRSASATTGAAAPTSPAASGWSASPTASRPSAAASRWTVHPERAPPCRSHPHRPRPSRATRRSHRPTG
jgi:hypothetical protein